VDAEEGRNLNEPDIDIVPEVDTVEPVNFAPTRSKSSHYIDNSHLRGMSEADMDEYLKRPAIERRRPSDSYDCSDYRVSSYGITRDASAYLKNKESID
jgi:hypothetical protein